MRNASGNLCRQYPSVAAELPGNLNQRRAVPQFDSRVSLRVLYVLVPLNPLSKWKYTSIKKLVLLR